MIIVVLFLTISFIPMIIDYIDTKILIIGILSIIVAVLFSCFATNVYARKINVYTQKGVNESKMWKGLKKYMEDFSMLDKRDIPEIVIWEHFLVYATAFGIADKVIKQLKAVYKELGRSFEFDDSSGYMYFMISNNFGPSFANSMSSAFSSAYTSAYSSTYSSGSGSGGGFSGGGGGGRRPVEADGGR